MYKLLKNQNIHLKTETMSKFSQSFVNSMISFLVNRKLEISTAPTEAKLREPAYSQVLIQNKIDRQRVGFRESGR